MHIEIENDLQGAYDLKWRGVALSDFDGRVWTNSYHQIRLRPSGDGSYRLAPFVDPRGAAAVAGRSIHYRVLMEPIGNQCLFSGGEAAESQGNFPAGDDGCRWSCLQSRYRSPYQSLRSRIANCRTIDSDELRLAANTTSRRPGQVPETATARYPHCEAGGGNHRARRPATMTRQSRWSGIYPPTSDTRWNCHALCRRIHWPIFCSRGRRVTANISPVRWR